MARLEAVGRVRAGCAGRPETLTDEQPFADPFFDVRMRGFPTRTDVDDAVALIRQRVRPLGPEAVELDAAAGRVLTAAVTATVSVPHFDRAAFDGYALRAEETFGAGPYNPLTLRVVGEALPGRPFGRAVEPGRGRPHHDRLADAGRGRRRAARRVGARKPAAC